MINSSNSGFIYHKLFDYTKFTPVTSTVKAKLFKCNSCEIILKKKVIVIAIVKPGSNSQYVPTLSEFLVFKVLLQFSLQNSSQFFKVLVVQATISHQLNALEGAAGEGDKEHI